MRPQDFANIVACHACRNIRRHDNDRVLEIHGASFAVGQTAVIENLQHDVPDVGMRLFDFVEQDDGIRPSANAFGEISAFVIPDVSRRSADQSRNGMLFHVFRHVDANHRPLVIKEKLRKRSRRFRLSDSSRSEKHEHADRTVAILQTRTRSTYRIRTRPSRPRPGR